MVCRRRKSFDQFNLVLTKKDIASLSRRCKTLDSTLECIIYKQRESVVILNVLKMGCSILLQRQFVGGQVDCLTKFLPMAAL